MKFPARVRHATGIFTLLVVCGLVGMSSEVRAELLGQLTQVQGGLLVKKGDGTPRVQGQGSSVAVGDAITTPKNGFARIQFFGNTDITLKPGARLSIERLTVDPAGGAKALVVLGLHKGSVSVGAAPDKDGRTTRVVLQTAFGELTLQGANAFVAVTEPSAESKLAAKRDYVLSSTAGLNTDWWSNALTDSPFLGISSQMFAQNTPGSGGGLAPGLYVHVIDGLIQLSNRGGVQQFAAGQFGFTGSVVQPPVIVPQNPGIQFNPPPAFQSSTGPQANSGSGSKPKTVDCEVR